MAVIFWYIIVNPLLEIYYFYPTSARLWWKRLPWCVSWFKKCGMSGWRHLNQGYLSWDWLFSASLFSPCSGRALSTFSCREKGHMDLLGAEQCSAADPCSSRKCQQPQGKAVPGQIIPGTAVPSPPASFTVWKQPHKQGYLELSGTLD